jgi:hypothetical protein
MPRLKENRFRRMNMSLVLNRTHVLICLGRSADVIIEEETLELGLKVCVGVYLVEKRLSLYQLLGSKVSLQ